MFGQNHDDNNDKPDEQIPEASIQGALNSNDNRVDDSQIIEPTAPAPSDDNDQPDPAASDDSTPLSTSTNTDDLIEIKQKALSQLSPLVGHLDQTPEERFRTTMMMIQASDNQALVPQAYEAANAITDEKAKAQALLDIVNEINYFTQHQS